MRRIEIDMSQQTLGQHLGLTFKQIQRHEKGTNRIGANRLQAAGKFRRCRSPIFLRARQAVTRARRGGRPRTRCWSCSARGRGSLSSAHFARITDLDRAAESVVDPDLGDVHFRVTSMLVASYVASVVCDPWFFALAFPK
jgi:hypothetical protein